MLKSWEKLKISFSLVCVLLLMISSFGHYPAFGPMHAVKDTIQQVFAAEICDPNAETVQNGSTGPTVQTLQTLLTQLGFNPGPIDGIFGGGTEKAVEQLQGANGLVADGIVGPLTWGKLCELSSTPTPPPEGTETTTTETSPPTDSVPPGTEMLTPAPEPSPEQALSDVQPPPGTAESLAPLLESLTPAQTSTTGCDPTAETVQNGSTGPTVQTLQTLLTQLGFNPGPIDGIFGGGTEKAVEQFQGANGLVADGIVGPLTWGKLCELSSTPTPSPEGAETTTATPSPPPQLTDIQPPTGTEPPAPEPSPEQALSDVQPPPGTAESLAPLLEPLKPAQTSTTECDPNAETISKAKGSEGTLVERLQNLLVERGFDPGPIDGKFGGLTEAAVKQFQEANGLDVDGIVGPKTWGVLCASATPSSVPTGEPAATSDLSKSLSSLKIPDLQSLGLAPANLPQGQKTECDPNAKTISKAKGSQGALVERLQNLLVERGFDPGPIDGKFGSLTEKAVKQFQEANSLDVDGIVGPKTWGALCETSPVVPVPPTPVPPVVPLDEICGDGIDNNLDGAVDENCAGPSPTPVPECIPSNASSSTLALNEETSAPECKEPPPSPPSTQPTLVFDPPCPGVNFPHAIKTMSRGPWNLKFQVVDREGLVLTDIKAGGVGVLDKLSATHFKLNLGALGNTIVRFCQSSDQKPDGEEPTESVDPAKGIDRITWSFKKNVMLGNILQGTIKVNYDIVVRFTFNPDCEVVGQNVAKIPNILISQKTLCFRLIPKISYEWTPAASSGFEGLTSFYRLEYGPEPGGRGLATFGGSTPGFIGPALQEVKFNAVNNGKAGTIDNIHDMRVNQGIFVPGCRPSIFDCFHMHWRWNPSAADVMVDPETGSPILPKGLAGTPYLVPGQTIDVGLVKFKANEQPSSVINNANPLSLVDGDTISTEKLVPVGKIPGLPLSITKAHKLVSGDHVLLYYVATSSQSKDTFFRHGIYVLNTNTPTGRNTIPVSP